MSISYAATFGSNDISDDAVSAPNVAYSADASIANDTPFTLTSLYLGSLNFNANPVTITGKDALGNIIPAYTQTVTVDQNAAVLVTLNYSLVSEVDFTSEGNQFTIDDVTISAVGAPEPSTYALMGMGLLAVAAFAGRRKFARA